MSVQGSNGFFCSISLTYDCDHDVENDNSCFCLYNDKTALFVLQVVFVG